MSPDTGHPFQRIARSIIETAIITGVLVRVLLAASNAHGADWHALVGRFVLVPLVLLSIAAIHLSNYPIKQWLWRAPVFALLEILVESVASLGLIALGRERWGTGIATFSDWPSMVWALLGWRFPIVCLFALVLAAVAQWVRRRELTAEWSEHHQAHHAAESNAPESGDVNHPPPDGPVT